MDKDITTALGLARLGARERNKCHLKPALNDRLALNQEQ